MKKLILSFIIIILTTSQISFSQENKKVNNFTSHKEAINSDKQHPLLSDHFIINTGIFIPTKTFKLRVDGASENELIDFSEDFGFNKSESIFAANFMWRFSRNKKWSLSIEYFGVKSSHRTSIEKDINWDNLTFKAGASLEAKFRLNIYRIFFGRSIIRKQHHELGGGLGVHAMDIRTSLEGNAFANDTSVGFETKSVSVIAPVPNIGFWYYYTPNDKWALTTRVDWFAITIENYGGSLLNIAPGVKYQVFENVGVGLNYRYLKTTFKVDKENWNGEVNMIFKGPLFTISANL